MKIKLFIIISLILCLSSCNKKDNSLVEKTNEVKTEIKQVEAKKPQKNNTEKNENADSFQSFDNMRSDYKESGSDGYSWRYRTCTYDKNDTVLSKEKLLSTLWSMDDEVNQYYVLCFYTDGVFKAGTYQGGVNYTGTYEVRDGKLFMQLLKHNDIGIDQYLNTSDEEYSGEFHPYSDNVLYSHELVINGYHFFPGNCYKENGETASIHNIPVVVEIKKAIVTDNVKLRSGPDTNYEQLNCYYTINMISEGFPNAKIEKPAPLLKYSDFSIIAHTVKKEKIGNDEDYWYYILYSDGFESVYYAWIYGAWIADFEEILRNEYMEKWWDHAKEKYNLKQDDER